MASFWNDCRQCQYEGSRGVEEGGKWAHLDILLLLGVHPHLGHILGGLMALAGIDVVRVGLNGSLTLIHGGLWVVDRQVGRVGERHVTVNLCVARGRRYSCRGGVATEMRGESARNGRRKGTWTQVECCANAALAASGLRLLLRTLT